MLYKVYKENNGYRWVEWRYFCECADPGHTLVFSIDDWDSTDITICNNEHWSLWQRIKEAVKLILGKDVNYIGVAISDEDRQELAKAIGSGYEEP
jgi:hypothetical protein